MANPDRPRGFRPAPLKRAYRRNKDAAAAACFIGDLVAVEADGSYATAAAGAVLSGASLSFSAVSTAASISVAGDPNQVLIGQDDGASTTPAQTHVGNNADHLATAGNTTTRLSAHEIDIDTVTTVTAGLRLLGFVRDVEQDTVPGVNVLWEVEINEHYLKQAAGV